MLGEYRSQSNGGHLINFHTSCCAREIIKQVFIKYKVTPDWNTPINSPEQHVRIDVPAISLHGDRRNLLDCQPTGKMHYIPTQRATVRVHFTTFQASYSKLPKLDNFLWEDIDILSIPDEDEMQENSSKRRLPNTWT